MDLHALIAIATLLVAMVLFISKLIPLEATALCIPLVLAITGTVTPADAALRGFGNSAVISLGAIFILSAGLKESGVATLMGRMLDSMGGSSVWSLTLMIMVTTCVLGAFMSNAATVAVFLPAVMELARRANISPSRLMMPLGSAAILSGTLTLISSTPNLILGSELHRLSNGEASLGMFEFSAVGVPICIVGIVFMTLVGVRLLGQSSSGNAPTRASFRERLKRKHQWERRLFKMTVPQRSELVGRSIAGAGLGNRYWVDVVQLRRRSGFRDLFLDIRSDLRILAGDVLYVSATTVAANRMAEELYLPKEVGSEEEAEQLLGRGLGMAEVILSPYSGLVGRTLSEIHFRGMFGLSVLAVWRRGELFETQLGEIKLELGDALIVYGPNRNIRKLETSDDLVLLDRQRSEEDVRRAPLALLLLAGALLPPVMGWLPLSISAIASAMLMVATNCVSMRGAYRAIDLRILFLIIGTIPLGDALFQTGVAGDLAAFLFPAGSELGPLYVLGTLFAVSALLSTTSNNAAAAVILAPVAFAAAQTSGVDVGKAFLAVAYGASCAFILPFAHQCNLMIMGPGGYRTKDFLRVGIGLSLVMAVTAVVLLAV